MSAIKTLKYLKDSLLSHCQEQLNIKEVPHISFVEDINNAENILGKTAYYDPNNSEITVFVTNRHPKDIFRSVAHEIVHHEQNERGEMDPELVGEYGEGYAQTNKHLRNLEKEAYLVGNILFRDWEDKIKKDNHTAMRETPMVNPKNLLMEGGAAGHMRHPFDLPSVKTGQDLIEFFEKAANYVKENPASVKIDGVNVSFKLVEGPSGKEFAVDRGSLKPIDIEGITLDRLGERFPEGHGMRDAVGTLLSIFNKAIPDIQRELKELGMWDDPTRFFNTEYVSKTTNVTEYDHNFLAIHGINQFYQKKHSRSGAVRPGLHRPDGLKDPSTEVEYSPDVLSRLISKVAPIAKSADFEVYSDIPTSAIEDEKIDMSSGLKDALNQNFSIIGRDNAYENSLGTWLASAENPVDEKVMLKDGRKVGALSKLVYTEVLGGTSLFDLLADEDDVKSAIDGAVFYHATRMLGNVILRALTSALGDVVDHEGVVLRDVSLFGPAPVKITGEFILGGMATGFRESLELNEALSPPVEPKISGHILMIPGGFKPPHKGHLSMIQQAIDSADPNPSKVVIFTGESARGNFTLQQTLKVLPIFFEAAGMKGFDISVVPVGEETMEDMYGQPKVYASNKANIKKGRVGKPMTTPSPMNAMIKYALNPREVPDNYKVSVAFSADDPQHGNTVEVIKNFAEARGRMIHSQAIVLDRVADEELTKVSGKLQKVSSSSLRPAIENGDFEKFKTFMPRELEEEDIEYIWTDIYGKDMPEPEEDSAPLTFEGLFGLVGSLLEEDFQSKMKKRLKKAHEDLLDGGPQKKGNYGEKRGGYPTSNAFVAKENQDQDEETVEETSSMGGGNVHIGAGSFIEFTDKDNEEHKKTVQKKNKKTN